MTTPRHVTDDIIKRAAEDSVSVYLDDFPGAAWDDGWFTAAYEIDSSSNGPCEGVAWEVYRDACKAAFVARRPVTGPDGDNPITDAQIRELRSAAVARDDDDPLAQLAAFDDCDAALYGDAAARDRCAAVYNARHAGKGRPLMHHRRYASGRRTCDLDGQNPAANAPGHEDTHDPTSVDCPLCIADLRARGLPTGGPSVTNDPLRRAFLAGVDFARDKAEISTHDGWHVTSPCIEWPSDADAEAAATVYSASGSDRVVMLLRACAARVHHLAAARELTEIANAIERGEHAGKEGR